MFDRKVGSKQKSRRRLRSGSIASCLVRRLGVPQEQRRRRLYPAYRIKRQHQVKRSGSRLVRARAGLQICPLEIAVYIGKWLGGGCGGYRPDDEGWGRGTRPVINVSWENAQAYVSWLSSQTGQNYRLLSEAEWEYVARAGSQTAYSWGSDIGSNRANCEGCGSRWDDDRTAPVGSFQANAFGVHDMHGNVWERVEDCWNDNYRRAPSDGSAWLRGNCNRRVSRGGSWDSLPRPLRSAYRNWNTIGRRWAGGG